jgi:hypothetical protein
MKKLFIAIWKDPVGSKVISAGIIGLLIYLYALTLKLLSGISISNTISKIAFYEIKLWIILVAVFSLFLITVFIQKIKAKKPTEHERKIEKIKKFTETKDDIRNILFRWKVGFYQGMPCIYNLNPFCKNHGNIPIKYIGTQCPHITCTNSRNPLDLEKTKNHIESILIQYWNDIEKSQ